MKKWNIIVLLLLTGLSACHTPTSEARRMVRRAEQLADTLPDSTVSLIDSVLRMPASFKESERMDMALLQAEALFGDRGQEISPVMDDDFFDDRPTLSTSPELERAAAFYAKKKEYAKAAHAALYSGFVQQHYDEKEAAMRSFKEAEQYGMMADDSLTMARSEYRMGKMLYDEYMKQEAQDMIRNSKRFIGNHHIERASIENSEAVTYILMGQFDNADSCLQRGMMLAEKWHSDKVIRKIHNNYSVLYRLQGKYDQAVDCLHRMTGNPNLGENDMFVLNLNLGNVYFDMKEMDSATKYYQFVELALPKVNVKKETVLAAYEALYRYAAVQNDDSLALQYREMHEKGLYDLMVMRQNQTIYRIQQQFDYESLQNAMNKELLRRQQIITLFAIFTIIGLAALAISQIRLAKIRKQEAIAKANLSHFTQQNKELQQKQETTEKQMMDLSMANETNIKAFQDLSQKYQVLQDTCKSYAQTLSDALNKEALIMRKLDIYLGNKGEKAYLAALDEAVFEGDDHWEALMKVFDALYPNVRESLL
ncbi:MAG: tetratricopeptide repeat protein, partial [Bacteroidales bacterium]|nr:tetratricopeptide repeat protein [Bacteroidales bacterium]